MNYSWNGAFRSKNKTTNGKTMTNRKERNRKRNKMARVSRRINRGQ